ncbi:MAG: DUF6463 family protein [Anaerolineae bacterium]
MRRKLGYVLFAIGIVHQIVGLLIYGPVLLTILEAGIVNTIVPPYWDRNAAFWFFVTGFFLMKYGLLAQWLLEHHGAVPRFSGGGLLALCVVGVVMMPASGFWLLLPVAALLLLPSPEQKAAA